MDIKRVLFMLLAALSVSVDAWATPPSSVKLTYDLDKQILHVSATHPANKLDKHFLRRIVIYKNDAELNTVYFTRQKAPSGIEEDIPVTAEGGDKIAIEVFCSQGGLGKGEVSIPVPPKENKKK